MLKHRMAWMGATGVVAILCLIAVCFSMSMDAAGSFHFSIFWLILTIITSFAFIYTMSKS